MKWIEVVFKKGHTFLINVNEIVNVSTLASHKEIVIFSTDGTTLELKFESIQEAKIQYDLIKTYINYGPVPGGLTIESE